CDSDEMERGGFSAFERKVAARPVVVGLYRDRQPPIFIARFDGGPDRQRGRFHGDNRRDSDGYTLVPCYRWSNDESKQKRNNEESFHSAVYRPVWAVLLTSYRTRVYVTVAPRVTWSL